MAIAATIDRNVKVLITEAFIRRHLKLGDSKGLSTLPIEEIFQQLTLIGHIKYALTENPTIYPSLIEQFCQTVALTTIEDGVMAIAATIDRNVKVLITEAFIRRHLKLGDSKGLSTLPIEEIFQQLTLIGYDSISHLIALKLRSAKTS
nr:hypothetical protein [Tanacetum cinerariifolium]